MGQFEKGGQTAWFHDQGHLAGFFHTYDRLQVGGENDRPRKVHILVPRDYETSGEHYPVIYMNDGDNVFFPDGSVGKCWWTAEALGKLYAQNVIRKVIVVGIYPINRDREYTHAQVFNNDYGGLEDYSNYLADRVKVFIDNNYRTLPAAKETTIIGSSHGGLAAFYLGCRHPDRFGNIGAMSSSFWVGLDPKIKLFNSLANSELIKLTANTLADKNIRLKIWLDWGLKRDQGFHNWFIEHYATNRGREMKKLLCERFGYVLDVNLFTYEDPEGEHSEDSWSRRLPMVLKVFYSLAVSCDRT